MERDLLGQIGLDDATASACSEVNLKAISAAFALIACADADLAPAEVERFRDVIPQAEACQGLDLEALEREFLSLTATMLEDYGAGKHRALEVIRQVGDDPVSRDRLLSAAQVAVVADGKLREVEEQALQELCELLGVDPTQY